MTADRILEQRCSGAPIKKGSLLAKTRQILAAPVFENDEEKTRVASLLNAALLILLVTTVGGTAAMIARAATGGARASPRAGYGIALLASLLCLLPESTSAQFGRNKLQYEVFDFKIIQTDHFDIYYYPREREAALDAARMAEIHDFIVSLPGSYDRDLGEGLKLSGGQCQRLLIARAIVRRPAILFFDEATSALDNRTQAVVSRNLERLNVSRLVIAHRLSTIIHADRIYVLDKGRIVEQGTYEELMQEKGLFHELARRQMV